MAKETAEQKLLRLIESTESQEREAPAPGSPEAHKVFDAVRGGGGVDVAVPSALQSFASLLRNPAVLTQRLAHLGLKDINKILAAGIVVVLVVFGLDFTRGLNMSRQEVSFEQDYQPVSDQESFLPSIRDLAEYISVVSYRNIFQPYERKVVKAQEEVPEEMRGYERIVEQTKDLKLVGISWLDTPESASAMIENTTTGITQFLRAGEKIKNITIKAIYADSVTLSYEGQEMEMRL